MSAEKKRSSALRQLTWTRTAAAANRANPAAETVIELEPAAVLVRTSSSAAADEELERLRDENHRLSMLLVERPPPPTCRSSSALSSPAPQEERMPMCGSGTVIDVSVLARTSVRMEVGEDVAQTVRDLIEERRRAAELNGRASWQGLFNQSGGSIHGGVEQ